MATVQDVNAELQAATAAWNRGDIPAVQGRLTAFWNAKAAAWTNDPQTQATLTLMDADAHSVWARVEQLLAMRADTGSAERQAHLNNYQTALSRQAALLAQGNASQRSINQSLSQLSEAKKFSLGMDQTIVDASYGAAVKSQTEKLLTGNLLGVPAWVWMAGAGLVVLLIVTRD